MKILYDHQTFSLQEYGGISRMYTELLKEDEDKNYDCDLSVLFSNNAYLKELTHLQHFSFLPKTNWKYKIPSIYNLNKIYSKYKIQNGNYQVFHPTYYDSYFLKHLKSRPFVVTVLDMIHEKFVDRYKDFALDKMVKGKKLLVQEATRVIAISESTKNDLVELYGTDKNKIDVIYLGSSLENRQPTSVEKIVDVEYILFIGIRREYKNFEFFLKSIVPLLQQNNGLKVVCGGGGNLSEDEIAFTKTLGLQKRVIHVPITNDNTLISLYSNALCFVFPTLYEGFGIPVLEAFSCGCPAAISNRSSLPEVGGDAVVYFEPEESGSLLNAVTEIVQNSAFRSELIRRGYERLSLFSWSRTRQATGNLYRNLV